MTNIEPFIFDESLYQVDLMQHKPWDRGEGIMKDKAFWFLILGISISWVMISAPSYGFDPQALSEEDSVLIQRESPTITCEDGARFFIDCDTDFASSSAIAKRDGPIVYIEDDRGRVSSYEYEKEEDILKRSQIFRFPLLGALYSAFWDNSNVVQLPKREDGTFAPWAISYFTYPEGLDVRTISFYIMTQSNPIIIRNMDPWLPPWNFYDHGGPRGMTGIDMAASGERVAIVGYKKNAQRVFAFRSINYDLNGGNPMICYRLEGGYLRNPNFVVKTLAEKIGVTQQILDIPTPDWTIVPLKEEHQPKILFAEKGERLMIPKFGGGVSSYDCEQGCWLEDSKETPVPTFSLPWPPYEAPIKKTNKVKAWLNGVKGHLFLTTKEPVFGTFVSETGDETLIYHMSDSFVAALLNQKRFFDKDYNPVELRYEVRGR